MISNKKLAGDAATTVAIEERSSRVSSGISQKIKLVCALAVALVLCFALAGCGGGGAKTNSKEACVGTWDLTGMTGASESDINMMKSFGVSMKCTLASDGTFTLLAADELMSGTWNYVDASNITVTADGQTLPAKMDGGKLSFEYEGTWVEFSKISDDIQDLNAEAEQVKAAMGSFGSDSSDTGSSNSSSNSSSDFGQ